MLQRFYSLIEAKDSSDLINKLFVIKTKNSRIQFFRYIFVGGFSAIADAGTLFIFTSGFGVHYLLSATLGFLVGTIVNYTLSVIWIFQTTGRRKTEIILFTLIGAGGLCLNLLILWVLVSKLGVFYMLAKLVSVSLVLIWSFCLRRLLFMWKPKTQQ